MTAFARSQIDESWGRAVWELRSVNHRYLETVLKLPDECRSIEPGVRARVQEKLTRGKVDCHLKLSLTTGGEGALKLNTALVQQLIALGTEVDGYLHSPSSLRSLDIMRWPGVIESEEVPLEAFEGQILEALDHALDELIEVRVREGARLASLVTERTAAARELVAELTQHVPSIMQRLIERFRSKVRDLEPSADDSRLEQECALLAQRLDVAEEIDRLQTHLDEVDAVLAKDEPCGRRLDFLMQELNREANTLGSKSAHLDTTSAAVDLKVLIEQMREQIQNIE